MGRKKTQMSLIQGESARQVSFSKRRTGIFKKASELCTLCAVEAAVVIFSPGGKAFTFGHPCFEAIMKKLADPENPDNGFAEHMAEHEATLRDLNKQYSDLLEQLKAEEKRGEELKQMLLLDKPIDDLNLDELLTLQAFMERAKADLLKRLGARPVQNSDPSASSSGNSTEAIDPSVTKSKANNADTHGNCHGVCNGD
ncbi:agamous-like MADS-box protein AGL29 isoform X2 [Ricinus communis]|uniref:Mads box protein, putative n=2 Tax=Ricinus communis TaxID=3988 RepID=B9T168_RICCO|nr:agamous-like MADS-box protein AGL29 isoform X2 [Ricinus communis]XP_048233357.1 agamous-like MADS-box protein AGL29 isoform X2 [Ricinus communis]EEF30393.1 mads box protein, putative [Ricinus communis]|eukprot:XP_015582587.1 agamous-like MADS-box protein AGL29 isoform X2 [Ricinus communis]